MGPLAETLMFRGAMQERQSITAHAIGLAAYHAILYTPTLRMIDVPIFLIVYWWRLLELHKACTGDKGLTVLMAFVLPFLWLNVGAGLGVGLPASIAWFGVVYESLR